MSKGVYSIIILSVIVVVAVSIGFIRQTHHENKILKEMVSLLEADSRIAEVLVTKVNFDESENKNYTTIKFLEYDAKGEALEPRYFTFPGNIIQFQSLVIRFDDFYVTSKHPLKGKSAYLFWKAFMLDGSDTLEYDIVSVDKIPQGYKIKSVNDSFERQLWERFWQFALDTKKSGQGGIRNAQIEAPGTMFVPGTLYTIKIEHDGGMRIDAEQLPPILRGEHIPRG